jgi:IPTL-CTERM motif
MQNPAFSARLGLLWCLFIFATCWCASTKAASPDFPGSPANHPAAVVADQVRAKTTTITVANSQANSTHAVAANGAEVHAIPTLDGFGLFVLAASLGLAVLWLWRRRQ